jgi:stearoyl-CoA desaturase (delta-9 desaturase)
MSRTERYANIGAVALPFIAFVAAIYFLWNRAVGPHDLVILGVGYVLTGFGVTVGYHRLLTHGAFATSRRMRYVLAFIGSYAVEGPVIDWVADHRKHHAHTDEEGDPHSPHVDHGGNAMGVLRGLWHAHVGWLWLTQGQARSSKYARDLTEDAGMRWINRSFPYIALGGLLIPFLIGFAWTQTLAGGLTALLWGGLVRIFLLHHVTWSINSICHYVGRRRFDTDDHSTNVPWLAVLSFGESWHHNHHAFPRSAEHGLRRWEVDPSAALIRGMEKLGLVWNVVRISPERQAEREAGAEKQPVAAAA